MEAFLSSPIFYSGLAGTLLSLLFAFFKPLKRKFDKLESEQKQAIMLVLSIVSAVGVAFLMHADASAAVLSILVSVFSNTSTHSATNKIAG